MNGRGWSRGGDPGMSSRGRCHSLLETSASPTYTSLSGHSRRPADHPDPAPRAERGGAHCSSCPRWTLPFSPLSWGHRHPRAAAQGWERIEGEGRSREGLGLENRGAWAGRGVREAGALLRDPASGPHRAEWVAGAGGCQSPTLFQRGHFKVTLPTLRGGEGTPTFG